MLGNKCDGVLKIKQYFGNYISIERYYICTFR